RRCSYRHVVLSQVQRSRVLVVFATAMGCTTPNATFNRASTSAEALAAPAPTADSSNNNDPESKRLADAFGGETPTSASHPAPPSVRGSAPAVHVDEEGARSAAEFDQHFTAATRSLRAGNFEDCEAELAPLEKLLGSLGPGYPPRVFELRY